MRSVRMGVVLVLVASISASAAADVRLTVKRDGSKIIYNVGSAPGGRGSDWNWLAKRHDRRTKYDTIIERYADKYNIDPVLVRAVIQVESDFNVRCVSNKGARGLMQLIPETAKRFGVKDVFDAEQNIHGGIRYLSYLLTLFPDDLHRALAAYNAGEGAVQKYGGIPPYDETATYVQRALTVYYGRPYGGGGVTFAGGRGKTKLAGGFGKAIVAKTAPVTKLAMLPGMKYLGTN
jgi:soluble lytic murein transglycosylase-like protein